MVLFSAEINAQREIKTSLGQDPLLQQRQAMFAWLGRKPNAVKALSQPSLKIFLH